MSLASDYAAIQLAASDARTAADAAAPAPLVGACCTLRVSSAGNLIITPLPNHTTVEALPADALLMAAWIVTNFGP